MTGNFYRYFYVSVDVTCLELYEVTYRKENYYYSSLGGFCLWTIYTLLLVHLFNYLLSQKV